MGITGTNSGNKNGRPGGLFGRSARAAAAELPPPPSHWGDPHSIAFVDRYLKPGDHVIDIGANNGAFAIQAARCGSYRSASCLHAFFCACVSSPARNICVQ